MLMLCCVSDTLDLYSCSSFHALVPLDPLQCNKSSGLCLGSPWTLGPHDHSLFFLCSTRGIVGERHLHGERPRVPGSPNCPNAACEDMRRWGVEGQTEGPLGGSDTILLHNCSTPLLSSQLLGIVDGSGWIQAWVIICSVPVRVLLSATVLQAERGPLYVQCCGIDRERGSCLISLSPRA